MSDYSDIIALLEKATGPDHDLNERIAFAVRWRPQTYESKQSFAAHEAKHDYVTAWIAHAPFRAAWPIPDYTASIDAALTLVPGGWHWEFHSSVNEACVTNDAGRFLIDGDKELFGRSATPAIAICIAALKARATLKTADCTK